MLISEPRGPPRGRAIPCIFLDIEEHWIPCLDMSLMFRLAAPLLQTSYNLTPSPTSLEKFLRATWDAASHTWSPKNPHQIKPLSTVKLWLLFLVNSYINFERLSFFMTLNIYPLSMTQQFLGIYPREMSTNIFTKDFYENVSYRDGNNSPRQRTTQMFIKSRMGQ